MTVCEYSPIHFCKKTSKTKATQALTHYINANQPVSCILNITEKLLIGPQSQE